MPPRPPTQPDALSLRRWSLRRARALVGTKFMLVVGLIAFVFFAWLVELALGLHRAIDLGPLLAAIMACVPAALWLGFFYLMDRHEPEPKQLVVGVALLGTLVAAPLADFVQYQAVPPIALEVHGIGALSIDRVIYAVLVAGLAQEMCKYAVVRYTIYMSREFDEPMDGIVYMMACGTGFAVWVNYHRLSGQGHQVVLSTGAAQAVVTTLAHASFAGALGYVMGRAKFSRRSAPVRGLLLMLGLLGAAALNGQFQIVQNYVIQVGMGQHPWHGVAYAAGCATIVFCLIWIGAQRLLNESPFRKEGA
jgi:RsiW-degrading membrane proteinase PrsW (M82 family)